jgi:hypothetical protein
MIPNKEAKEEVDGKMNYMIRLIIATTEKTNSLVLGDNINYNYDSLNNLNNNFNAFTSKADYLRVDDKQTEEHINEIFFETQNEKSLSN